MSRFARLKPKKIEGRVTPWLVNVPPHISDNGRRKRLYFETEEKAEREIESIRRRRMQFGETLEKLSPARASEALKAYELLQGYDVTLLDVVTAWLKAHKDRNSSIPFLDLFNQVLEAKRDRDPDYTTKLRQSRDRWPELHNKLVCDITPKDLESILSTLGAGARNEIMRYLNMVFNVGIKRGYLRENPISRLDFARRKRQEVETPDKRASQGNARKCVSE
jgi:hypothetical protein